MSGYPTLDRKLSAWPSWLGSLLAPVWTSSRRSLPSLLVVLQPTLRLRFVEGGPFLCHQWGGVEKKTTKKIEAVVLPLLGLQFGAISYF